LPWSSFSSGGPTFHGREQGTTLTRRAAELTAADGFSEAALEPRAVALQLLVLAKVTLDDASLASTIFGLKTMALSGL
jgi:hypothetical protein